MWWLLLLADLDTSCNPDTLVTNLGHECVYEHIVVPKVKVHPTFTTKGVVGEERLVCPSDTESVPNTNNCTRTTWSVVYTTIIKSENPYLERWSMMGKYGFLPHQNGPQMRCHTGKLQCGVCMWELKERKVKK